MIDIVCIEGDKIKESKMDKYKVIELVENNVDRKCYCMKVNSDVRRIYLNIDNIYESKIYEVINKFRLCLMKYIEKDNIEFVVGIKRRGDRIGLFVVCVNYMMYYKDMESIINKFMMENKLNSVCIKKDELIRLPFSGSPDGYIDEDYYECDDELINGFIISDLDDVNEVVVKDWDRLIKVIDLERLEDEKKVKEKYVKKDDVYDGWFEKSRYEVLDSEIRRIYLDIDVYKECEIDVLEIIEKFKRMLMERCGGVVEEPLFEVTFNPRSGHSESPATSYHVVCYNYCMRVSEMENFVSGFVYDEMYYDFDGYCIDYSDEYCIDCSVYNGRQLFKLPYFIGLKKGKHISSSDHENYHRLYDVVNKVEIYEKDEAMERRDNMIIQDIAGAKLIDYKEVMRLGVYEIDNGTDFSLPINTFYSSLLTYKIIKTTEDDFIDEDEKKFRKMLEGYNKEIRRRFGEMYYDFVNSKEIRNKDVTEKDFINYIYDIIINKLTFN